MQHEVATTHGDSSSDNQHHPITHSVMMYPTPEAETPVEVEADPWTVAEQPMVSGMMNASTASLGGECEQRQGDEAEEDPMRLRGGCWVPCAWPFCISCWTATAIALGIGASEAADRERRGRRGPQTTTQPAMVPTAVPASTPMAAPAHSQAQVPAAAGPTDQKLQ